MSENQTEITLGVLNAVEGNRNVTQRLVAKDLGVALGLVNSYLKRCIKKGFVKIRHAPANRYSYYLTPAGFSEKSRLTAEYLSSSFNFFRNARLECSRILEECESLDYKRVVLAGAGDLAEIIILCAQEFDVEIAAIVDAKFEHDAVLGFPVAKALKEVSAFDCAIVTSLAAPQAVYFELITELPAERVFTPSILCITRQTEAEQMGAAQ